MHGQLFVIYVNDIPQTLSSPTHLFADVRAIHRKVSAFPTQLPISSRGSLQTVRVVSQVATSTKHQEM